MPKARARRRCTDIPWAGRWLNVLCALILERVSELVLANIGVASALRARLARIFGRVLTVLPATLIGAMANRVLRRNLKILPEPERAFYREYFNEMIRLNLTKRLVVNQCRCMVDFIDNYHFQTEDLQTWGGRILILEAEDDRGWTGSERSALKSLYPKARSILSARVAI